MNVNAFFTPRVSNFHKLSLIFNIKEKIRFISAALLKLPVSTKATTNCFCATKVLVSNCQEKRNLFFLFIIYIVCYKLWNQKFINHATKPCFGNVWSLKCGSLIKAHCSISLPLVSLISNSIIRIQFLFRQTPHSLHGA